MKLMTLVSLMIVATLLGAALAPAAATAAGPVHQAPSVERLRVYQRTDGAVMAIARVSYRTRSKLLAAADYGRLAVSLTRQGHTVTRVDRNRLQGAQSHGFLLEQRILFSPSETRALGLRGARRKEVLVGVRASHQDSRSTFAESRLSFRISPTRVSRANRGGVTATGAQTQQGYVTTTGWPPDGISYGTWTGGLLAFIDWQGTGTEEGPPYTPYFGAVYPGLADNWVCANTVIQQRLPPKDGFLQSDGTFQMANALGDLDRNSGYECWDNALIIGKVAPLPTRPDGAVDCANATLQLTGWAFETGTPYTFTQAPLTLPCIGD
jgi:hypothetical protein